MIPESVVLTGATGGLGRALAVTYARPGRAMLLLGRDEDSLVAVGTAARKAGAIVECATSDFRATDGAVSRIAQFDDRYPVDLLIANAGVKTGNASGVEPSDHMRRVLAVNLGAPLAQVQNVLPRMLERRRGQIALVASLAGLAAQADLLSYSASKAGLIAYGTGLRRRLRDSGVSVSVVVPGFVDTPMTHRHLGPTPGLLTAARAAEIIQRGLIREQPVIAFPRSLHAGVRLMNLLPAWAQDLIMARLNAEVLPDRDESADVPGGPAD